jgi:hypothetical protein
MNTEAIVLLPGIISLWMVLNRSLEAAMFSVYLPVLMLIPDYFRMPIDGLPDPGFGQATILPIGIGLCWLAFVKREWRFSPLDFFVVAFVGWEFISDLYNIGYKEAQNSLFDALTLAMFPYMIGKALIEPAGLRAKFARRFVWLLFVVCVLSLYEFKMGNNLFRPVVMRFFPGQDPGAFTQIRWGFGRIAGPYVHAILMCTILGMGYLLCRWLSISQQWERHFKWFGAMSKSKVLTFGILAGMFMTLSRGPWMGTACGAILASVGLAMNRPRALKRAILILVGGGLLIYTAGKTYLAGASAFEGIEEQASAAYKAILVDEYEGIVMQQPIAGWGHLNWPRVPGMPSIDNNYLLTALNSGLVGVALLLTMTAVAIWRLFASAYFASDLDPAERAFRFTMLGIILTVALSTATVYLAAQLQPLFYIFLGWSEGCIVFHSEPDELQIEEPAAAGFGAMRVIA